MLTRKNYPKHLKNFYPQRPQSNRNLMFFFKRFTLYLKEFGALYHGCWLRPWPSKIEKWLTKTQMLCSAYIYKLIVTYTWYVFLSMIERERKKNRKSQHKSGPFQRWWHNCGSAVVTCTSLEWPCCQVASWVLVRSAAAPQALGSQWCARLPQAVPMSSLCPTW